MALTTPLKLINIIELVLSVIIGGLMGDLNFLIVMYGDYSKLQFTDAVVYGFLIINVIVVASILLKEEIPKKVRLVIAGIAYIMYIACGSLILYHLNTFGKPEPFMDETYGRILSSGIFCIFLAALYVADLVFVFKSQNIYITL